MAEEDAIENLVAARTILKTGLEKSKVLAIALDKTGSRLEEINQSLSSLQAAVRPNPSQRCTFLAISDQIDLAIGPTAAVIKVFDAVCELEEELSSHPCSDLSSYLTTMRKLEEAMKFLSDNCRLAIQWWEGIIEFMEVNAVANDHYMFNVTKSLELLLELQVTDQRARLSGGILFAALDKLEIEFEAILTENSIPTPLAPGKNPSIAPPSMPEACIQKLQAIVDRLYANGRLKKCLSVYAEIRICIVRISLQDLDSGFLEKSVTEFDDVQDFEDHIDGWCKHFELAVKHVMEREFILCKDVFKCESENWMGCFADIAVQSCILSFLQFGMKVTECKKNPIKLLKLLDMFATLDNLRVDFNRLFRGEACIQIQTLTRDLVNRVVNSACEIFWELPLQVELQRSSSPPSDGTVPGLVTFVTDYCNQLLGDNYRPILTHVLGIYQNWKHENYDQTLLLTQVYSIMKEIGLNLDSWSKCHQDLSLSYLFMMNNHCHLYNLKGTKLGDMMGESWLQAHEQYKDYYAALYFKNSWGRILLLLNQDGPVLSSPIRDLNKRQKAFTEAFDDLYKKHSSWVVADQSSRQKMIQLLLQAFLPVYRSHLQNYGFLAQHNATTLKYTPQALENMLRTLFQPKPNKSSSSKYTQWTHKIKNIVADNRLLTLTAV